MAHPSYALRTCECGREVASNGAAFLSHLKSHALRRDGKFDSRGNFIWLTNSPNPFPDRAANQRNWRENNPDRIYKIREGYRRKYRAQITEKNRSAKILKPERERAGARLNRAIRSGWLERPFPNAIFHHPDYQRPYYGVWLTQQEHQRIHAGLLPCPECTDYSAVIETRRRNARAKR